MNKTELKNLKSSYAGKRNFQSKEKGCEFDVFSDAWLLGYKKTLYLEWMNELEQDVFLNLRLAIAHATKHYAYNSINGFISTLRTICDYLEPANFEAWWLMLTSYKKPVKDTLFALCKRNHEYNSHLLTPLYDIVKDETFGRNDISESILDESSGAYSEIERDNILEALRIETLNALDNEIVTIQPFTRLRSVLGFQLIAAIIRRPTQLVQIKWCDLLRIGQAFKSHKESNRDWQPLTQHHFSDMEQLHLRTFKGKNGTFRTNAESRSHRLEPDLSELLLQYYQVYEIFLCVALSQYDITLSESEIKELMQRLPLFPVQSLFSAKFDTKENLFQSVSDTSESFHLSAFSFAQNITYLFNKKFNVKSDRIAHKSLAFKNNRWRHTQLTLAAWMGLNPAQVAACSSCQSKGAPMGCYPCDNFRPLETANHQQYLDKAERKLAINSQSGHPATVQRMHTIILYIRVTIALCKERKTIKVGG